MSDNNEVKQNKKGLDIKVLLFWSVITISVLLPIVFFVSKKSDDKKQAASSEMFELVYDDLKEFDELNNVSKGYEVENLVKKLDEVVSAFPKTVSAERAEFYKGYVNYYAGKYEESLNIFNNFVKNNTKSYLRSKAYYFLSFVNFELDKNEDAVKSLQYIVENINDSYYAPLAYYRLGQLYDLKNDNENALSNYMILVEKFKDSSQVDAAKQRIALLKSGVKLLK